MTCGFLWWLTRGSKDALPDFMLARLNYAKLSSNYQEFNQSYGLPWQIEAASITDAEATEPRTLVMEMWEKH
jgi:hypothetical protein